MIWYPTASNWKTFKKGDKGWEVWAFQLNLPTAADGDFGPLTDAAVKKFQKDWHLFVDGIAGPATQQRLSVVNSHDSARKYKLPVGLLQGLVEGESGNYVACVSGQTSDLGRDYGAYQIHLTSPSQSALEDAFNIFKASDRSAKVLKTQHDIYLKRRQSERRAWELAVLYHNWPYASDQLSRGLPIYSDGDDKPRQWIIDATKGALRTANEWVAYYISTKTIYVTDWNSVTGP